jgi:hypothetical protein
MKGSSWPNLFLFLFPCSLLVLLPFLILFTVLNLLNCVFALVDDDRQVHSRVGGAVEMVSNSDNMLARRGASASHLRK